MRNNSNPIETLVICNGGEASEPSALQVTGHPAFLPNKRALLPKFLRQTDKEEYLSYLQRRIARNPRDLMSHSQRILISSQLEQAEQCFGAMADLFLATGKGGRALKQTLLKRVSHLLSEEQRSFLIRNIAQGLEATAHIPTPEECILAQGIEGETTLVTNSSSNNQADDFLLEQAYEFLHEGRLDDAREYLEQALHNDPSNELVGMELLALYQHHRLRHNFYKTYTELSGRKLVFPDLWHKLDNEFNARHTMNN